ncbi:MAG: tetratricopeptide repeat protein [Bryobacteraceae bacterium]
MIRVSTAMWLAVLFVCRAAAAEQNQLDANKNLFTVLAALNAAGYDADLNSPNNDPLRERVRKRLAALDIPVLPEIKNYYGARPRDIGPYISLALSVRGAPDFEFKTRTVEIPPDALPLDNFRGLLSRFYVEAHIEELWEQSQPAFDKVIARYHEPVSQTVLQVNSYLRNPTAGYLGRRFQIYVDLLAAPNQVQTRSFGDDYYVVLTPSHEPRLNDIRHAYLHFLLDPLGIKYGMDLLQKRALGDFAQPAPALDDSYKNDFPLLATECLIKSVESRLAKNPALVPQALAEGYILTPFFAEELPRYEKQPLAMRLFFPEMVRDIDSRRENKRLADVKFAAAATVRTAKSGTAQTAPAVERTTAGKTLEQAEQLYTARNLDPAKQLYLKSLEQRGDASEHARAYYGLARIAVLQKDGELAERLFQKALDSSPDAQVKAWVYVYLGRLSDVAGDRGQAAKRYQDALAVNGASLGARKAAEKGIQETFKK